MQGKVTSLHGLHFYKIAPSVAQNIKEMTDGISFICILKIFLHWTASRALFFLEAIILKPLVFNKKLSNIVTVSSRRSEKIVGDIRIYLRKRFKKMLTYCIIVSLPVKSYLTLFKVYLLLSY